MTEAAVQTARHQCRLSSPGPLCGQADRGWKPGVCVDYMPGYSAWGNFRAMKYNGDIREWYIRYVDDFILLGRPREELEQRKGKIRNFLKELSLELHPEKSKIYPLSKGISFLGFRIFPYHKLLKKSNVRKVERRMLEFQSDNELSREDAVRSFESWLGYAKQGNTYGLRKRMAGKMNAIVKQGH